MARHRTRATKKPRKGKFSIPKGLRGGKTYAAPRAAARQQPGTFKDQEHGASLPGMGRHGENTPGGEGRQGVLETPDEIAEDENA